MFYKYMHFLVIVQRFEHFYVIALYKLKYYYYYCKYSGTSLMQSPTGLGKSDPNGEVTVLQGTNFLLCVEYYLGLSKGDRNGEVT